MFEKLISFIDVHCIKAVADLFYPPVCEVCGRSLVTGEQYICSSCLADFPFVDEDYSAEGDIIDKFEEFCRPQALYALFYYNKYSNYKKLIYKVKYGSDPKLGIYLGQMLGRKIKGSCDADCIIPVPLHPKRLRKRGYNQASEIAKGVAQILGIEVLENVIVRVQNNVSQTGKTATERLENVSGIFKLKSPELLKGKHVMLLDDVITTGATVGACLKEMSSVEDVTFSLACIGRTI